MASSAPVRSRSSAWTVWVLLGAILVAAFLIRWRLRGCPLERDEGEFAYIGRLILEGVAPYGVAGNHKFPGVYLAYAALMAVFGKTIAGIHTGMLAINLANSLLLFFLGRRLFGNAGALAAAAAWAVMSVGPSVFGNAGHLTHFVVLAVLGGGLLLWRWLETRRDWCLIGASFCLGVSVVFRQTSLIFVASGAVFVWLAMKERRPGHAAIFAVASIVPLLLTGIWLWAAGVFPNFWQWTITQAAAYGSQLSISEGLQLFFARTPLAIGWNGLIWLGALAGLIITLFKRSIGGWFVIGLLIAGGIALLPGFYFREHYYVQVLPAIALLFGIAVQKLGNLPKWRYATWSAAGVAVLLPLAGHRNYFLESSPTAMARYIYKANPFPETVVVAEYLRKNSDPGDLIAVLGSEPQIFFYAERRSATSLIYAYPLMEHHQYAHEMQETMVREIEQKSPKFVVFVNVWTSWLGRPDSDQFILQWAGEFLPREYRLDGIADILAEGSQYAWGAAAARYQPRSPYFITVYRR